MKKYINFFNLDNLAILLSILALSLVLAIAVSLTFYGKVSYLIIMIVIVIYGLIAIKSFKPGTHNNLYIESEFNYSIATLLGAFCIGLLLFGNQFEYASIWGDHGVYVNAASHFREGGEIPFSLSKLGVDLQKNTELKPPVGVVNFAGKGLWQFHGLPTWPALMAASQLSNDGQPMLALLFSINIILFFSIANCFVKDKQAAALATLLFASLPLLWHQSLYATSEMLLLSIFLSCLLLSFKLRYLAVHLSAGLFAYGVTHTGILILAPAVGIVFFIISLLSPSRIRSNFVVVGFFSALASVLSYMFAMTISIKYTQAITSGLFGKNTFLAYLACLAPILMSLPYCLEKMVPNFYVIIRRTFVWALTHFRYLAGTVLVCLVVVTLVKAYLLGWTQFYMPETHNEFSSWSARSAYVDRGIKSLLHLSLLNIFFASGGLGLVAFVIIPFHKKLGLRSKLLWTFTLVFLVVFGVYRIDVTNNYYASRYFLPILVPCLLFLFALIVKHITGLKYWVVPAVVLAFIFNGATIGRGFFLGDGYLKQHLRDNLKEGSFVTFYGSQWLRYMVYPVLLERNVLPPNDVDQTQAQAKSSIRSQSLVTDAMKVLGGNKSCIEYIERRIPWQITYPTKPKQIQRNVCIITPHGMQIKTLDLGNNQWLMKGQFDFVVVKPKQTKNVKIVVNSLGWWASKKPFVANKNQLKPRLSFCGKEYTADMISPKKIVFHAQISNAFCKAKLNSATFIPAKTGQGSDKRSLGVDIYSISIIPI